MHIALASILALAFAGTATAGDFVLKSPDFAEGGVLPLRQVYEGYGCTGNNASPALTWENPPAGTKGFGLTLFDPDAGGGRGWWHWAVFNLPARATGLPADAGRSGSPGLPAGAAQGRTSFGAVAYGGACPPVGDPPHHYVFTLYALDVERLDLAPGSPCADVAAALRRHALGTVRLTARFGR